jgi:hypothetical protein
MNKIYGKKIGAIDLRRMYLTAINHSGASFIERKAISDAVGYSIKKIYQVLPLNYFTCFNSNYVIILKI